MIVCLVKCLIIISIMIASMFRLEVTINTESESSAGRSAIITMISGLQIFLLTSLALAHAGPISGQF